MPSGGIRTHNLSRRAAADLRVSPHCHWDRQLKYLFKIKSDVQHLWGDKWAGVEY